MPPLVADVVENMTPAVRLVWLALESRIAALRLPR